jgi:broad specificity phosphatase PhoE
VLKDWPQALWLVRHGESTGNVAAERAHRDGQNTIDIAERDADVGLTRTGTEQARAVGAYLAGIPDDLRPTRALFSPYRRAAQTGSVALQSLKEAGDVPITIDERLRDRELGLLDRLTQQGIAALHPDQADARRRLGKFYHRPPGGESWADVALRLRGVVQTLRTDYASERVIIFTHDLVVMLFRYLLEGLDEASLLEIGRRTSVVNGGVTLYEAQEGEGLVLRQFNALITPEGKAVVEEHDHGR